MRLLIFLFATIWPLCIAAPVAAHSVPVSSLDLTLQADRIDGALTVHTAEIGGELGIEEPHLLFDRGVLESQHTSINDILQAQLHLRAQGGADLPIAVGQIVPEPDADALRIEFVVAGKPPAALEVLTQLFPDDPTHRTFVNIREGGELAQQFLFAADSEPRVHYAGTAAGALAVLADFVPLGAVHVWGGFDHLAFVIGLILLGGSLRRLALIVTAFTLGHSITLALAALDIFSLPAWLIEPAIALSIIVVGADNLLRGQGKDMRALFAAIFGLVHGFGFAFVLREMGLPQGSLAVSLFGFNLGVELAQLAVVIPLSLSLAAVRTRSPLAANRLAIGGSLAVIAAGVYWFVDRVRNLAG